MFAPQNQSHAFVMCQLGCVCGICRKEQNRRGSLELLESEKQMCNLISKYSPEYVRSRALESPKDAFAVLVSRIKPKHTQLSAQTASLLADPAMWLCPGCLAAEHSMLMIQPISAAVWCPSRQ
jgi:hypothetical protein